MSEFAQRFHKVHARIMDRAHDWHSQGHFTDICDLCESEIEKILAAELLDLFCPTMDTDNLFVSIPYREAYRTVSLTQCTEFFERWLKDTACELVYGPRTRAAIFPQVKIGRMRVDFVVMSADQLTAPLRAIAAIECDGHDFHERTKEQAARDRKRDRALTASGIPFFRFTGSEIWRDAKGCMLEVENFLWREMFGRDCPLRKYDEEEG